MKGSKASFTLHYFYCQQEKFFFISKGSVIVEIFKTIQNSG